MQSQLLAADMIMGDFNMHARGYLAARDDNRAKLIRPIMQRYNLNLINDS